MPNWLQWTDLILGTVGAIGTVGILILLHQWYVDYHKRWPYRLRDLQGIGGSPDGRSGLVSYWIENLTNKNAYFTVWAILSNGQRLFPKRVHVSPSGYSGRIPAPVPPHEEAVIDAVFEDVPEGLDIVRAAISEGRRPQLVVSEIVSISLDHVRAIQGLPKWNPADETWPVAGWHYYKDIRFRKG